MRRFTIMIFPIFLAALLAVAPSLSAQVSPVPQARPFQIDPVSTSSDAPIGARDVLDIKVFQDPALNTRATVTDDGKITMPVIGKLDVSGLTPVQVETKIKALLETPRKIVKGSVVSNKMDWSAAPACCSRRSAERL